MNNDDIPDELKDLMDEEPNIINEVKIDENVLNTPDLSKMLEMVQNMSPQQRNNLLSNISQKAGINPDNKTYHNMPREYYTKMRLRKKRAWVWEKKLTDPLHLGPLWSTELLKKN